MQLKFIFTSIDVRVELRLRNGPRVVYLSFRLQFFGALCWHSVCTVILWPTFPQTWVWGNTPQPGEVLPFFKAENSRTKEPFCKGPVSLCHPQSSEPVWVSANDRRDEWVWYATFSLSEFKFKRQNKQKEQRAICSRQDSKGKWKLFPGWGGCGVCWGRYNTALTTSDWGICL